MVVHANGELRSRSRLGHVASYDYALAVAAQAKGATARVAIRYKMPLLVGGLLGDALIPVDLAQISPARTMPLEVRNPQLLLHKKAADDHFAAKLAAVEQRVNDLHDDVLRHRADAERARAALASAAAAAAVPATQLADGDHPLYLPLLAPDPDPAERAEAEAAAEEAARRRARRAVLPRPRHRAELMRQAMRRKLRNARARRDYYRAMESYHEGMAEACLTAHDGFSVVMFHLQEMRDWRCYLGAGPMEYYL